MRKSNFTPVDIVGISLGVVVVLMTVGSLVTITRTGNMMYGWGDAMSGAPWSWQAEIGGSGAGESEQTVEGTFSAVEISGVAGEIVVTAWEGPGVKVRSVKRALNQASMDSLRTDIQKEGGRLTVREKREPRFPNMGSISFYIAVPKETRELRVNGVSGRIRVQGLPAGVRQSLETVSGSIETDGSADLKATSISGSIKFSFAGKELTAKTVSGSIRGDIESLDPDGRVDANSVSGSVRLAAWEGLSARASLHSVSGSVACAFPLSDSQAKRNSLEGTIGKGGATLNVGTTSGSIHIDRK